ncbi:peptidylprolyl isomerase [Cohnella sp. 56]|uniref:peptidylprolyl isomerase n=1 Tax=Cohnella sp. 56 TaxID=3113722 RepID=UPI0030EA44F9
MNDKATIAGGSRTTAAAAATVTAIAASIGALLILLALTGCAATAERTGQAREREAVFATVNGEPLQVGELRLMMSRTRSALAARFQEQAGADGDVFSRREVGGEQPLEVWKQAALKALVRAKVEQLAAVREGVLDAAGYSVFLDRLAAENRERAAAFAHGKVVYGPTSFTEDTYFDYVLTNADERLKEKLASGSLAVSEREVRAYYEARKAELYRQEDRIRLGKIVISYVDADGRVSDELKEAAARQIEEAAGRLAQGEDIAELAGQYSAGPEAAEGAVQLFDSESARTDQRYRAELWDAAQKLQPGQTSGVLAFNNAFYLLQCLDRTAGGVNAYEEVKADARSRLLEAKFAAWLDAEAARAQVQIDEQQWERID